MNAVLYSQPSCSPCKLVVKSFAARNMPLEVINIQEDEAGLTRVKELGYSGTPVVEYTNADGERESFHGLRMDVINKLGEAAKTSA